MSDHVEVVLALTLFVMGGSLAVAELDRPALASRDRGAIAADAPAAESWQRRFEGGTSDCGPCPWRWDS